MNKKNTDEDKELIAISSKSVETSEDGISFLYNGDIKKLINIINSLPVTDLTITEPQLDEIFMHYYEKGGEIKWQYILKNSDNQEKRF